MNETTIYFIYNKESGDHYCCATSTEVADKIIEESKANGEHWEDLTYVEMSLYNA